MKRNLYRELAIILTISSPVWAAETPEAGPTGGVPDAVTNRLTIEAAVQLAMEENPELKSALGAVDAATGHAWQSGRWENPSLDLNVEEWPIDNGGNFSDAKQTIGMSQTLPWPGRKKYDRQAGDTAVRLTESELAMQRTTVARNVRVAYHRVVVAEASLAVGGDLLQIAQSAADAARKRVEAGATAYQEQLRSEIQLEQMRNEAATLQVNVVTARESLFTLIGRPDLLQTPLSGNLSESCRQQLLEMTLDDWQQFHPKVLAAQAALHTAELDARRAKLDAYPDVTASVAGGRLGETDQSIIEFGFSIPLPLLDSFRGRKTETAAQITMARSHLDAVHLQLALDWNRAVHRYRTAGEQAESYRQKILPGSAEALRLVQTGFEEGRFEFIDLLDTQRTFAESRLAYQQRLLELNIAEAELEALLHPNTTTFSTQHNP